MVKAQNVKHHVIFFLAYYFLNIIHYVILISVVAFFHFLLNQKLSDIESWIFDKSWELISIIKMTSSYIIFKILAVKMDDRMPLRQILGQLKKPKGREILVSLIFLYIVFFILTKPAATISSSVNIFKIFISYFGSACIILSDCLILIALSTIYPLGKRQFFWMNFFLASISTALVSVLFQVNPDGAFFIFMGKFLACVSLWSAPINPVLFALLFFAPMISLFGLDPIWGNAYSFFSAKEDLSIEGIFVVTGVISAYLMLDKKKDFRRNL